jgi:TRAP-type C4-dicarboxylate transport system substrate-binding protein
MLRILAAALVGMLFAGSANAEQVNVKIGTFVPAKSVGVSKVIKPWMAAVAKDIGTADVTLKGYWGGSLGRSPFKQYELVKNGVADITWVLPGYTPGQFPELQVFELPFMAENGVESSVAAWRLVESGLVRGFEDTHPIGVWTSAASNMFTKEPIKSLYDLKNLKIRSVGSIHARWLKNFGAAPQTMSSTKLNEALNRGVIDGLIQGWTGMRTFKTMSLVTHAHEVPVGTIPFILLMNKKTWNGLPANAKASFTKHGGLGMARIGGAAYDSATQKIRKKQLAAGKIKFVPADDALMARYRKDAAAIHAAWIKKTPNGAKIFEVYKKALAEVRGK